jgi:hypothetical protein
MKRLLLKKKMRRASKNRMATPPKNTPNAGAKMAVLLRRFLEVNGASAESQ